MNNSSGEDGQTGDFVAIEFGDSGTGIPPDLLSKIFDLSFPKIRSGRIGGVAQPERELR